MNRAIGKDYFQFYSRQYALAAREGKYEEALVSAAKGYLVAVELADDAGRAAFLQLIEDPIRNLVGEPAQRLAKQSGRGLRCSFCGRKKSEVKLVLGAHGAICRTCAAQVQAHLASKARPQRSKGTPST